MKMHICSPTMGNRIRRGLNDQPLGSDGAREEVVRDHIKLEEGHEQPGLCLWQANGGLLRSW